MIELKGTMTVEAYLYKGVAYYGETKPEVWHIGNEEVVTGHPFTTWGVLKGFEIEGVFDFWFDRETGEYTPVDIFFSIR